MNEAKDVSWGLAGVRRFPVTTETTGRARSRYLC